jgi:hypothetical protein
MTLRNICLAIAVLVVSTGSADARRGRSFGGSNYVANGKFGLGLELGAPFGINGKYFLSDDGALNFGLGADGYYYRDQDGFSIYLDYLWHPLSLANPPAFQLPLYIGVGGRLWDFDDNSRFDDDGVAFGLRVPGGIAFDFNNVPLDVFIQLTFVFDFYRGYRDNTHAGLEGSIGIRFWFD